jgi:hypothetical protein
VPHPDLTGILYRGLSVAEAAARVIPYCRVSSLAGKYPRWSSKEGKFITQKEFVRMDEILGVSHGTMELELRNYPLKVIDAQEVVTDSWPNDRLRSIIDANGLYRIAGSNRKEIYSFELGRELSGIEITKIFEVNGMEGNPLCFKEALWGACLSRGEAGREREKRRKAAALKTLSEQRGKIEAQLVALVMGYIRRRKKQAITLFYLVAPAASGGRVIRYLRANNMVDHKELHLLIHDIYEAEDISQEIREQVLNTYNEYKKHIEEMGSDTPKAKKDQSYREAGLVIFNAIDMIEMIEDEIPYISWEGGGAPSASLAHHVRDRVELLNKMHLLQDAVSRGAIEEYLGIHCPTWRTWMRWNRHIIGRYDSVACFFMWLWKLCGLEYSKTMREMFYFVGSGRTGNSTVANALRKFLEPISCIVDADGGQFGNARYLDKRFGTIPENTRVRSTGHPLIKSLSGSDDLTINQKNQPAFCARVHVVMLFLNNRDPEINYYDNSEYSRAYVLRTCRPEDEIVNGTVVNSESIEEQYCDELYGLLAYCHYVFAIHKDKDFDLLLKKPEDMKEYIIRECLTPGSRALRVYLEEFVPHCPESKFKMVTVEELAQEVIKFSKDPTNRGNSNILPQVLDAIDAAKHRPEFPICRHTTSAGAITYFAPSVGSDNIVSRANKKQPREYPAPAVAPVVFNFDL